MPAYKTQHFLPSAYLKYFSVDQQNCDRKSFVWRFDGKILRFVPVASQCSADYFYSKEKAAEAEKIFQVSENTYCECVDKIQSNQGLNGRNFGDLLLSMFDFHLRNAVHRNLTGMEGIEAYSRCVGIFVSQILLGRTDTGGEITESDVISHLVNFWGVKIISTSSNQQFLASDHPSVWITLGQVSGNQKTKLHLVVVPLTPKHIAIGFDKRVVELVSDYASAKDIGGLNTAQIQNAASCIYMSRRLPDEQMEIAKDHLNHKVASPCEVGKENWKFLWKHLPAQNYFSFMRLRPLIF